jgi:hypothetical protein
MLRFKKGASLITLHMNLMTIHKELEDPYCYCKSHEVEMKEVYD